MSDQVNATADCSLVGEYVDEAECPPGVASCPGEVVRPQVVGSYLDLWGRDDDTREFTVLLKDGRVVAVRGHGLTHDASPQSGQHVFGVVVRNGAKEVLVALFNSQDVSGIFCGELRPDRKSA